MYPLPCPASETVPFFLPSLVRVGRTDSMRIIPYGESMMHVVRRCTWYCCTWYGILGVAARPHLVRATPAPHIGDAAALAPKRLHRDALAATETRKKTLPTQGRLPSGPPACAWRRRPRRLAVAEEARRVAGWGAQVSWLPRRREGRGSRRSCG